jgi:prepilin-type N-terminal cleavage/methylation domain-containing protein
VSSRPQAAFTLTEILVVCGILAILAGIVFGVMSRAKSTAFSSVEANQLRQLYLASNIYEADHDQSSAPILSTLVPTYCPVALLKNSRDVRMTSPSSSYPSTPWLNFRTSDGEGDPLLLMRQRSAALVSYAYLNSFRNRIKNGTSYPELRSDPAVGYITGLGLMKCATGTTRSGCTWFPIKDPLIDTGQPPSNLFGSVLTVRTDGSLASRHRKETSAGATMSFEQLFLFWELNVEAGSAGPD